MKFTELAKRLYWNPQNDTFTQSDEPLKTKEKWPIHRAAPAYVEQSTETEVLVTLK